MATVSLEELFVEKGLKQVTVWTRGVEMNKEARDVVVALARGGGREGKYVQAFENYVDLPDRVNVPIRAYARISSEPIESKYLYENENPDVVVLIEEGLTKGNPYFDGVKQGAVLVVNTARSPEEIKEFLTEGTGPLGAIVTVDAAGMAEIVGTLSGAEGATDATGIGGGWAGPIVGAIAKATDLVSYEALEAVVARPETLKRGYEEAQILKV